MIRVVFLDGEIKAFDGDQHTVYEGNTKTVTISKNKETIATLLSDNVKYIEHLQVPARLGFKSI